MFIATATGKVGNVVMYARNGDQITRVYQSQVKNPKTNAQMLQRARFANAVKFYQKAVQHFFKFAYQDQKKNESAYNAFMRHNIGNSSLLKKESVDSPYFPALGRWVMSQGSLAAAFIPVAASDSFKLANTGVTAADNTVGAISSILIGQGFNTGDIITIVTISTLVTSLDFDLSAYLDSGNLVQPQWDIRQFIVDAADDTAIADIPRLGPSVGTLSAVDGGLSVSLTNPSYSHACACIVTRKGSGITYASNSELVPNATTLAMLNAAKTAAWQNSVIVSWGAEGDAILHGSIADGQNSTSGTGTSGSGSDSGSSSTGSEVNSRILTINGSSTPPTISTAGTTDMVITGVGLSSSAPVASGTGISVSGFSLTENASKAGFVITVADNYGSGSVSYMGQTVARIVKIDTSDEGSDA